MHFSRSWALVSVHLERLQGLGLQGKVCMLHRQTVLASVQILLESERRRGVHQVWVPKQHSQVRSMLEYVKRWDCRLVFWSLPQRRQIQSFQTHHRRFHHKVSLLP